MAEPWPMYTGHFLVTVDGIEIGSFTEVTGLSVEVSVESLEEGGENGFVHKLPGRMSWPNIVLKRGLIQSDNLFAWFEKSSGEGFAVSGNKLERTTAAVSMIDQAGTLVRSWEMNDAFPVKWNGPSFAAGQQGVATEELEIAHHGFRTRSH